jgi:hypothetical protein
VSRLARILLLAAVTLGMAAPAGSATPTKTLGEALGTLWTTVLETPSAHNPFGNGSPADACWDLGGTVAPLGPLPDGVESCTVKPGTKIFVAASTFECSPFPGDTPGVPATEAELRACARENDANVAPTVTVDGKPVPVTEVETGALNIVLPADSIFVGPPPAGTHGISVAHGWVALLHPLRPGKHTIVIHDRGSTITTIITVKPKT